MSKQYRIVKIWHKGQAEWRYYIQTRTKIFPFWRNIDYWYSSGRCLQHIEDLRKLKIDRSKSLVWQGGWE